MTEQHDPFAPPKDLDPGRMASGDGTGYEFSQWENLTISRAASRTRGWGVISLVVGALFLVAVVVVFLFAGRFPDDIRETVMQITAAVGIPIALVNLVTGGLYVASGGALKLVVTTAGSDVPLLMTALNRMANAFRIEVVVMAVAMVIGFVVGLAMGSGGGEAL